MEAVTEDGQNHLDLALQPVPNVAGSVDHPTVLGQISNLGAIRQHVTWAGLAVELGFADLGQNHALLELVVGTDQQPTSLSEAFDDQYSSSCSSARLTALMAVARLPLTNSVNLSIQNQRTLVTPWLRPCFPRSDTDRSRSTDC